MFRNVAVIPPGTGTAHQVNLEYLSRAVCEEDGLLFPDSVVGTDSHVTMVNGLGILGWGEYTTGARVSGAAYRVVAGLGRLSEAPSPQWRQHTGIRVP